ncbi:serine hydrolase domain-containing protein [Sphingomonas sp. DT-204]|uniref:serine hydrolase domain-containing protein n=1 Tax=Sphingomonas sp. DT-204 TaxID=3396166 RepID=UPI003F1AA1C7
MFRTRAGLATLALVLWGASVAAPTSSSEPPASAASQAPDSIDEIVRSRMAAQHIPGLSLTVLRGGEVVRQSNHGLANVENAVPVSAETAFNIASVSKQIIASGIMLLAQEGKIDLDASLSRYIEDVPAHWRPITVRHLLTHTSGLVRDAPGFSAEKDQPVIDVVRTAYPVPLLFNPGEKFEYCNTGYFILAELITRTSGTPWPQFFQARLFQPLGMTATRTTSPIDIIPKRAGGYLWKDGRFENAAQYRALRPSGAFVSTPADLAKWEQSLVRGTLLSKRSLAQMWTKVRLNGGEEAPYGFGWRLEEVNGVREIGHDGSLPGFRAYYARYPDRDLTIIALANANYGPVNMRESVRAVATKLMETNTAARQ